MSAELGSQQRQLQPSEVVAGRYKLTQCLARGGMGEVFAAFDQSTGRAVALKRLLPAALRQRAIVVHFMREYHALSELRHPRIIEVYDYGVDHDVPYYTMELLDGRDLRDLSPLPFREACLYLRDVASSLALLHARRLLHRDVSPRNVRCTSDGHCKLLDFGAMIAFGLPANVTGTAPCVPPEALQGAALDQRTDLYSLGALAYCVLTGRHCYEVAQLDELPAAWAKPVTRPKQLVRDIPVELDELVMSLLSLDPMKRPKSAAEVIDWLSAIGQLPADDIEGIAQSFLTSSQLCGREAERKEITRRLQRALTGQGCAVLVEGQVGVGKSRMLAEAALLAQTCGLTAVRAVARRQRGASYSVARDLVAALQQIAPLEAEQAGAKEIRWPDSLDAHSEVRARSRPVKDAGEARARLQQTLTALFCQVARARPLLLTVDDIDHADEFSAALIAALAHETPGLPLIILASQTEGSNGEHFDAQGVFRNAALRLPLTELERARSAELVQSMFGQVPNIERLNDWIFRIAHGNPKLTVELAEHLLSRGIVRYVAGTWVVPSDDINEAVPHDMAEALAMRIHALSAPAVALAELLSVRRGGATAELCLGAGAASSDHVFAALDELVRHGVLESAGHEYVFAQDVLRETLQRALSPERLRALHRRWADVLLSDAAAGLDVQLEAGWHLVHTDDEVAGADLLARVGPLLVDQGLAMATAIPAIEKALAVYEAHDRPLSIRLRLRSTLVLASYLFDYRLAERYGEETLAVLYEVSGLALAQRLSRFVGVRLGLALGLLATSLRRLWTPYARRGPRVVTALQYFVRSAMGLIGVRAVALDAPGTAAILAMLAPLAGSPPMTSGRVIFLACKAFALQMVGREGELDRALREALRGLRRGRKRDMSEVEYQSLLVGLLTCDGINECYRERSQAQARADLLEGIGTSLARAAAHRIRMLYHLRRGDNERAEHYRRLIDLHGIQGGTTWQVEWFAVAVEGMAGSTWTDLVMLRRSLDRLERLAEEVPSLGPMRDGMRIAYHFRRGEFARAAELGEAYVALHPPRSIAGWAPSYAVTALSLVEAGRAERARQICEHALGYVSEPDRAYFVFYAPLEVAHATALAVLGERQRADEILRLRFDRLRACGEHVSLVTMYQYQAKIARLVNDRPALMQALQAMRSAALASGFPAVILLADRVAELRARHRSSPIPPPNDGSPEPDQPAFAREETAVTTFLRGCESPLVRSQQALAMLAQCVASDEAYLFTCSTGEIALVATLGGREAPPQLTARVHELLLHERDGAAFSIEIPSGKTQAKPARPGAADAKPARPDRFRVILLSSQRTDDLWVGAAAVRETDETDDEVAVTLVADIGNMLAEDLRTEQARLSDED
jgi:hypothetical protein